LCPVCYMPHPSFPRRRERCNHMWNMSQKRAHTRSVACTVPVQWSYHIHGPAPFFHWWVRPPIDAGWGRCPRRIPFRKWTVRREAVSRGAPSDSCGVCTMCGCEVRQWLRPAPSSMTVTSLGMMRPCFTGYPFQGIVFSIKGYTWSSCLWDTEVLCLPPGLSALEKEDGLEIRPVLCNVSVW
jgi:hypothetical protein